MVKKSKKKVVKAWAIFIEGKIENADYFVNNDCCCCDETMAMAIYGTKKEAQAQNISLDTHKIVQISLLPIKPKK